MAVSRLAGWKPSGARKTDPGDSSARPRRTARRGRQSARFIVETPGAQADAPAQRLRQGSETMHRRQRRQQDPPDAKPDSSRSSKLAGAAVHCRVRRPVMTSLTPIDTTATSKRPPASPASRPTRSFVVTPDSAWSCQTHAEISHQLLGEAACQGGRLR